MAYLCSMISKDLILSPIKTEMEEFEVRFKTSMQSDVSLLEKINHYIIKKKESKFDQCLFFNIQNAWRTL